MSRVQNGLILSQRKYTTELIDEDGLGHARPIKTPLEQNVKLTSRTFDLQFQLNEEDLLFKDDELYRRLVGKLMHLTMTLT